MNIKIVGYTLTISLQKTNWEEIVVDIINKKVKKGEIKPYFIELIKAVRKLGYLFPEDYDRHNDVVGLRSSKEFVEKHWPQYAHVYKTVIRTPLDYPLDYP